MEDTILSFKDLQKAYNRGVWDATLETIAVLGDAAKKYKDLTEKHWEESRQIALYDDELKAALKMLRVAIELLIQKGVRSGVTLKTIEEFHDELYTKLYRTEATHNES